MSGVSMEEESKQGFLHEELLGVLSQVYYSILRVDLEKDTVYALYSRDRPGELAQEQDWPIFLNRYCGLLLENARERAGQAFFGAKPA